MVGEVEDTELSFPNMWKKVVSGRCLIVPKEDKEGGAKAAAATQQPASTDFFLLFSEIWFLLRDNGDNI